MKPPPADVSDMPAGDEWTDRLLGELDCALRSLWGTAADQPYQPPDEDISTADKLTAAEADQSAALMRINMAGELAAQGLYRGQALLARQQPIRQHLLAAAQEEEEHLRWCRSRLAQLGAAPSLLNPLWYGGALLTGLTAGLAGDRWSLGFVAETEKQVEQHLTDQLERLPKADSVSRRLLRRMRSDEARHGVEATQAGGRRLPPPISALMAAAATVMKRLAAKI